MKRILGLLGWLGVVLVLGAVAVRLSGKPELQNWSQGLAIAGLVSTLLYTLSQWRDIARSFSGRNAKYGTIAIGSVLVFLAILVLVNWISNRQNKRWDLTSTKQFSLSDQTRKIVTELAKPVTVKVFHATGDLPRFQDRLGEYQYLSTQLKVEYIDVDRNPGAAKQYEIQQFGTIVFEYDGRTERTTSDSEQDLTNTLIKVIEGKPKKVYFVQGHGERDSAGGDRAGYSQIAAALKGDNFDVAALPLAQEGTVPVDATVLIVAGPATDFLPGELDQLRGYLKRGGKLALLIDPPDKTLSPGAVGLIALVKEWGIEVGSNLVLDQSGMGRQIGVGPEVPLSMKYPPHPITDQFRLMTAYPLARSVGPVEGGTDGKVAQSLVETSPKSWAESDIKGLYTSNTATPDLKTDKAGPISVAAAVSSPAPDAPAPADANAPKPETRIVVVGDSDFASNGGSGMRGNSDLFLNMVNWLAQQESLIAIRPRDPEDRRIQLTEDQGQVVFWLALVIIPLALIGTGVRVWWRRR